MIGEDPGAVRESMLRLSAIAMRYPHITIVPAHDGRGYTGIPLWSRAATGLSTDRASGFGASAKHAIGRHLVSHEMQIIFELPPAHRPQARGAERISRNDDLAGREAQCLSAGEKRVVGCGVAQRQRGIDAA